MTDDIGDGDMKWIWWDRMRRTFDQRSGDIFNGDLTSYWTYSMDGDCWVKKFGTLRRKSVCRHGSSVWNCGGEWISGVKRPKAPR